MNPRAREPLPDALRAAALAGVLLVNAVSYLDAPWGPLLGETRPEGHAGTLLLQGLIASFVQGKAYPLLAFLFGVGLALAWRKHRAAGVDPHQAARRRQWKLLALGVAHGLLLYFGDILTMYALAGLLVLGHVDAPWQRLRRLLRRALVWAIGATTAGLVLMALSLRWPEDGGAAAQRLADMATMPEWLALNASAYLWGQVGAAIFFLPVLRLCMLAGIAAARLRWLHHRRWRTAHRRIVQRAGVPVLLLNLGYAAAMMLAAQRAPQGRTSWWVEGFSPLVGLPMAAVILSLAAIHAANHPQGDWNRLVPLGRRTLSCYLGHSLACAVLFSALAIGWRPDTAQLVVFALALWVTLVVVAGKAGRPWWPERWLAR